MRACVRACVRECVSERSSDIVSNELNQKCMQLERTLQTLKDEHTALIATHQELEQQASTFMQQKRKQTMEFLGIKQQLTTKVRRLEQENIVLKSKLGVTHSSRTYKTTHAHQRTTHMYNKHCVRTSTLATHATPAYRTHCSRVNTHKAHTSTVGNTLTHIPVR